MDYLDETAKALGVSRSTVCRAINRTQLINYETRGKVLSYLREHYPEKLESHSLVVGEKGKDVKSITAVMPYKPCYFWDVAMEGMNDAVRDGGKGKVNIKYMFYAGQLSEDELLTILDGLNPDTADALALVPVNTENVMNKLRSLSEKLPVALFNEYCGECGSFIKVISDGKREGSAVADMMLDRSDPQSGVLILSDTGYESKIIEERVTGFVNTVRERDGEAARYIERVRVGAQDMESTTGSRYVYNTIFPALIARKLDDCFHSCREQDIDIGSVYIPNGYMHPLLIAMRKLNRTDISVFGHEMNSKALALFKSGGFRGGYVSQDVYRQGYVVIDSLIAKLLSEEKKYPDTYITDFHGCRFT